jgi:hypothetical protein
MLGDPVGIDEYFLPAHVVFLLMVYGSTAEVGTNDAYGRFE